MQRRLYMGAWTGLLAGAVTTVTVAGADLADGRGLDGTGRVASLLGLGSGLLGSLVVLLLGVPLVVLLLGLVLAALPPRVSGAAAGLALGLLVGLAAAALLSSALAAEAARLAISAALSGAWAGLLTGFLYSRYARTLRRPGPERPFGHC